MNHNSIIRKPEARVIQSRPAIRIRPEAMILILALVLGACLRFYRLGGLQMSADEGASWAAADAPSVREVIAIQATHNAGKLPFHDLLLHGWIGLFGDGLYAMRSLSALLGVLALVVVAPATSELIRAGVGEGSAGGDDTLLLAGPLASLFCAVSVIFIKYDGQARMYSLLLAASVAQVWFFLRTIRTRSISDAIVLALLTAAATAASLVAAPLLAMEGIWLLWLIARQQVPAALAAGLAMLGGLIALSPALYHLAVVDLPMVRRGIVNWLVKPPWWEPAAFFSKALGSFAFPVFAVLLAWGCVRQWTRIKAGVQFSLLWMWAPPILLVIGSYLWRPMFVERYALYSFTPLFILAALGVCAVGNDRARMLAIAVAVGFALGHVNSYWRRPHDTDWRAAAQTAGAALAPGDTVAVLPAYAVEVLRYYTPQSMRHYALPYSAGQASRVVVVADQLHNPSLREALEGRFPRVLGRFRGVTVRSR